MRIALDAFFDLHAASLCFCTPCQRAFTAAFLAAAEREAEDEGVEIEVVCETYADPELMGCDSSEEAWDTWQAIHDRVVWNADTVPDDCEGC